MKTFSCLHCDYTTDRFRNWQRHSGNHGAKHRHRCNQCDFSTSVENGLKIHISRDHSKNRRVAKGGTGRKMPTTTSSSCAKFAAPKTARQKALQEKGSRPKKVHFAKVIIVHIFVCDFVWNLDSKPVLIKRSCRIAEAVKVLAPLHPTVMTTALIAAAMNLALVTRASSNQLVRW